MLLNLKESQLSNIGLDFCKKDLSTQLEVQVSFKKQAKIDKNPNSGKSYFGGICRSPPRWELGFRVKTMLNELYI